MNIEERANPKGAEYRAFAIEDFEFRADDENTVTFEGVASVVDEPYTVRDAFGEFQETIKAGAFNKTLKDGKADVALFVNHRHDDVPLATRLDGSLILSADPNLRVKATMDAGRPDVQIVRSAIERGQLRQMSIGMNVPKDKQSWNADYTERIIREARVGETSIVWKGANHLTSAAVRALDELIDEITADDYAPDELRRMIAHLESLLPGDEPALVETTRALPELAELWAKRYAA
jgi:HK97 family phage prohead protease